MRYGRRRARFPWRRTVVTALTVLGALTLVMATVNWRSLRGLYRLNLVTPIVRQLEGRVRFDEVKLKAGRLTAGAAAARLRQGLADLGLQGLISPER